MSRFIFEVIGLDANAPDGRKVALLLKWKARKLGLRVRYPAPQAIAGATDVHAEAAHRPRNLAAKRIAENP